MRSSFLAVLGLLTLLISPAIGAQPTATLTEPKSGIELVWIKPGCYQMGSDYQGQSIAGQVPAVPRPNEAPRHEVCVDGFWLGKFETTRGQWENIMHPQRPSTEHRQQPVVNVAPREVLDFLRKLNVMLGTEDAVFRLPTEVQWEYACWAGEYPAVDGPTGHDMDIENKLKTFAWHYPSSTEYDRMPRNVGEMLPNAWGLHDMLGNAMEMVEDDFDESAYRRHARLNPVVIQDGARFVVRGGSFKSEWWHTRCGARNYVVAGDRLKTLGLRVIWTGRAPP